MRNRGVMIFVLALCPALSFAAEQKSLTPAETKAAFLKMLDRARVDPDVKPMKVREQKNGLEYETFTLATEKKADGTIERMPFLVVKPEENFDSSKPRRYPVVIVMHGTGGNKDAMRAWLEEFARRGFIGVSIDARYHGDRSGGAKGATAYVAAITKAWKTPAGQPMEHPFYFDTCWDLWRLLDVLEARSDVDKNRIGMMGTSMGGIQTTWLAASVDDRVKAAAPLIGVQSFRWSLENDKWQGRARTIAAAHDTAAKDLGESMVNQRVCRELWGKVIPGILEEFDCPNMLKLFVGRPLYIGNGELDPNCPLEGAKIAFKSAEDAFTAAGCREKLKIDVAPGVAHAVSKDVRNAAVEFMTKALSR